MRVAASTILAAFIATTAAAPLEGTHSDCRASTQDPLSGLQRRQHVLARSVESDKALTEQAAVTELHLHQSDAKLVPRAPGRGLDLFPDLTLTGQDAVHLRPETTPKEIDSLASGSVQNRQTLSLLGQERARLTPSKHVEVGERTEPTTSETAASLNKSPSKKIPFDSHQFATDSSSSFINLDLALRPPSAAKPTKSAAASTEPIKSQPIPFPVHDPSESSSQQAIPSGSAKRAHDKAFAHTPVDSLVEKEHDASQSNAPDAPEDMKDLRLEANKRLRTAREGLRYWRAEASKAGEVSKDRRLEIEDGLSHWKDKFETASRHWHGFVLYPTRKSAQHAEEPLASTGRADVAPDPTYSKAQAAIDTAQAALRYWQAEAGKIGANMRTGRKQRIKTKVAQWNDKLEAATRTYHEAQNVHSTEAEEVRGEVAASHEPDSTEEKSEKHPSLS